MTDSKGEVVANPAWGTLALLVALTATIIRVVIVYTTPLPLFFDEAQYWVWAQDLALGYYSKPPMVAWFIAATTFFCGDGTGCVRLSAPLFHGATAFLVYFLGRHFYDAQTGFWSTVTYAALPGVTLSAVIVSTDAFLLFFWTSALLLYVSAEKIRNLRLWSAMGVVIGLGILSKYAMVFFFICLIVHGLWRASGKRIYWRREAWLALAIAVIIYLPNFLWNWVNGFPSYRHTVENINLGDDLFNPNSLLEFLGGQFGVFGPILFAFFLFFIWRDLRSSNTEEEIASNRRLLYAFSIPVLAIICFEALLSRAHANWAAVSYVAATVLVVGEIRRLDKAFWLNISLALHVAGAVIFYNFDLIARTFELPISPGLDPARRLRGWDIAANWASEIRQDFPDLRLLFDDRKVMSEMLYYIRPHPMDSVIWNPNEQQNNHFELKTDLSQSVGESFLYIIKHDWPERAADSFADYRHITTFRSRAYTGDVMELRAYLLDDFQGYQK